MSFASQPSGSVQRGVANAFSVLKQQGSSRSPQARQVYGVSSKSQVLDTALHQMKPPGR